MKTSLLSWVETIVALVAMCRTMLWVAKSPRPVYLLPDRRPGW